MGTIVTTGFGQSAIDALARVLADRAGPLEPGIVVCDGPMIVVNVRRALGRLASGIAGIDVVTTERLIEGLSERALASAGERPATALELHAGVRAELGERPGLFGAVAGHRTTADRLVSLEADIVGLSALELDRLERTTGLTGDAFRVLGGAFGRLGSARRVSHQVDVALEHLASLPPMSLGPVVVFLPEPRRPLEGRVLAALARRRDVTVLVGISGHLSIDQRHRDRLAGWGLQGVDTGPTAQPMPRARVLEAADPEDEVRAAVREIVGWAASGTPLAKTALLYTTTDPYASIIDEQLEAAGLPFSSPGHRALGTSLAGRTLLRLVGLVEAGMERSAVMTLISSAPVVTPRGRRAPAAVWDRLSRQAGVVDADDWQERLSTLAASLESEGDRQEAEHLIAFIAMLAERLSPADSLATWQGWTDWAGRLLTGLVRVDGSWPERERVALELVTAVLGRLSILDVVDPAPTFAAFLSTLTGELETNMVPGRPVGQGLLVAPLRSVVGLGFERVVVVGIAEGVFPTSGREDSLLPDQVRAGVGGMLLPRADLPLIEVRAVASVVAGAEHEALLTTARGDLRSRRLKSWPRALDELQGSFEVLESHHRGLVEHGRPASLDDLRLRLLIRHTDAGDPVHTHPIAHADAVLAAGLGRHLDRGKNELTPYTGRAQAGLVDPSITPVSATALEDYAACPRSYLLGRVLRIGEDERPERIEEITARDRGTLMHEILERFIGEALVEHRVPAIGEPWSSDDAARLERLVDESVAAAAAQGITGGRVQTELLRRELRNETQDFLATDDDMRAQRRSTPFAVEHRFGFDDEHPQQLNLSDGRHLRVRGMIDRVDLTDDGGVLVIDYKGGSASPFARMEADPLKGGRRLQLPLYAQVVADELGRTGPRTALYWLTKQAGAKGRGLLPMELDDQLATELDEHVAAALDGISAGLFPAVPGGTVGWPRLTFENCKYCDFDRICPTDRQREWESICRDEVLTPIDRLLGREYGDE